MGLWQELLSGSDQLEERHYVHILVLYSKLGWGLVSCGDIFIQRHVHVQFANARPSRTRSTIVEESTKHKNVSLVLVVVMMSSGMPFTIVAIVVGGPLISRKSIDRQLSFRKD